jgi:hypothetical protein
VRPYGGLHRDRIERPKRSPAIRLRDSTALSIVHKLWDRSCLVGLVAGVGEGCPVGWVGEGVVVVVVAGEPVLEGSLVDG